ncbi:MAG: sodium:solute symporter [Paludibacteraceae bacterium]|nr:sodium:solute symporter [Paludibacteraceae bacterium]MEE3485049.1 sodium:solute symporter [Bacteroidales bacterium]
MWLLSILLLYFGILFVISHFTSKRNDNADFFLGGHRSSWWSVAIGMVSASISGVTFISVPGWVSSTQFSYMQMVVGFVIGYVLVAYLLLPLYYKNNVTSIYSVLDASLGRYGRKTAALFFLLNKTLSSALKLYVVVIVLRLFILPYCDIPLPVIVFLSILIAWFYSHRSGIRTIVWTDFTQTIFIILALILLIITACQLLNIRATDVFSLIQESDHSAIFNWEWNSKQNFFKEFFSGIFIVLVMTGMDQDMMQKNLSCRNLKEAQKNMLSYGVLFIPLNLLLLSLGVLIMNYNQLHGITDITGDQLLPHFAQQANVLTISCFVIGLLASTFSSIDSAMTSITTSIINDFKSSDTTIKDRKIIHFSIAILLFLLVMAMEWIHNEHAIDVIYTIVSYLYGPVLGLFIFALSNHQHKGRYIPFIAILSILLSFLTSQMLLLVNYTMGYELLLLNGGLMYTGLRLTEKKERIGIQL